MMKNRKIRVLIADDHELIRIGLKKIIEFEQDIVIVGEAANGQEVFEILVNERPDVLLLDYQMPLIDGIEVLKLIQQENINVKTIMLTIEKDSEIINEAIRNGAEGYLLKESASNEIGDAIRAVFRNKKYIDKAIVDVLFSEIKRSKCQINSELDLLSKRELDVLVRISKGLSNKEIGDQLFLSEKTVKNYATSVFRKINASDRVRATIFAIENAADKYYQNKFFED